MTDFLTADTNLPSYMMFPRFLLDMEINETAKMLYIILLDRARLSQKNEGWSDTDGHVFIYFTIEALAEVLHKSQMTVKTALAVLEKQELIFRKRQGPIERNSDFALEQVFNVIDSRYRSKKPLIITTNLTLSELNNAADIAHKRIYDRILERCIPVRINNRNIRQDNASANLKEAKKILLSNPDLNQN